MALDVLSIWISTLLLSNEKYDIMIVFLFTIFQIEIGQWSDIDKVES